MSDFLGKDMRKENKEAETQQTIRDMNEGDIQLLESFSFGVYDADIARLTEDIQKIHKQVNEMRGVKESDTGVLASVLRSHRADSMQQIEPALHVGRVLSITKKENEKPRYLISIKNYGKYVTRLSTTVKEADIETGMRIAVERSSYRIVAPLPPEVDPTVGMMQVEEKPRVTYEDIGGCKEQIAKLREVVEEPLLNPGKFKKIGIDPPRGVILYGPPGTGKTLCARAVANKTDACFIRVIGSELVQKYIGEGSRIVRELFKFARTKKSCIIFFDEIDAIGATRFDSASGNNDGDVQRTMLELINQLDGFDPRGNIKVILATNRIDVLDPALLRPGRVDRKIEFGLPEMDGRSYIFKIHSRPMNIEGGIRYELLSRLCPNTTGAEIKGVCTEAGMFAIRQRRKVADENDFMRAVQKVVKAGAKFSATPVYMNYT